MPKGGRRRRRRCPKTLECIWIEQQVTVGLTNQHSRNRDSLKWVRKMRESEHKLDSCVSHLLTCQLNHHHSVSNDFLCFCQVLSFQEKISTLFFKLSNLVEQKEEEVTAKSRALQQFPHCSAAVDLWSKSDPRYGQRCYCSNSLPPPLICCDHYQDFSQSHLIFSTFYA